MRGDLSRRQMRVDQAQTQPLSVGELGETIGIHTAPYRAGRRPASDTERRLAAQVGMPGLES
jgi:hypothetical protein